MLVKIHALSALDWLKYGRRINDGVNVWTCYPWPRDEWGGWLPGEAGTDREIYCNGEIYPLDDFLAYYGDEESPPLLWPVSKWPNTPKRKLNP